MAWSISDLFPDWGDTGTKPSDNTQRDVGDQVPAEEYDYIWYAANELENEVRAALTDIDSDADGAVDEADSGVDGFVIAGNSTVQGDISDDDGNTIWNDSAKHVEVANISKQTQSVEVRTSDPSNLSDGDIWIIE